MDYKSGLCYTSAPGWKNQEKTMPVNSFANYRMNWKPRRAELRAPLYLSLAALLERDILSGALPRGTRLPPQRELADWLDIDFTTVTRAFNICRDKNLIYGITGRGTFVSPAPGDAIPATGSDDAVIDLGTVRSFPSLSYGIVEAMHNILVSGHVERLFSYSDPAGSQHHLAAGRRLLAAHNVEPAPNGLAVFAGAQNALSVALLSLFAPGDALATDPYTYSNLIGSARLAHVKLVPVPGDGGGMRADELDRLCRKHRLKGLFIMPEAANPTGLTLSEARRDEIAAVAAAHGLILIEDDLSPFTPAPTRRPFFSRLPDSTLYIAAYTAMLAPALRITYAAFPAAFRERLLKGLFLLNLKAGSLDAEIVAELILSGAAAKIMAAKREAAQRANHLFDRTFPKHALAAEDRRAGRFPFFRTLPLPPSAKSGPEMEALFRAQGVNVLHSCRFAVGKARQHDFLRVSLSSVNSLGRLDEGLHLLKSVLRKL